MRTLTHNLLASMIAAGLATAASAQPPVEPTPAIPPLTEPATPPVTTDEGNLDPFDATTAQRFDDLDSNGDGLISPTELPEGHPLNALFASYDSNGDRAVSRAEFQRYLEGDEQEEAE